MNSKPHAGILILILLLVPALGLSAENTAAVSVANVRSQADGQATLLVLEATGPVVYTSYRPSETQLVVDLPGVVATQAGTPQTVESGLIASYRLLPFRTASGRNVLRLEVSLRHPAVASIFHRPDNVVTVRLEPMTQAKPARVEPVAAPTRRGSVVRAISLIERPDHSEVAIEAEGQPEYKTFELDHPSRLVLDLPNAVVKVGRRFLPGEGRPVTAVRIGQFSPNPPVARVVIDLKQREPYKVSAAANQLRVRFTAERAKEAAPAPESAVNEPSLQFALNRPLSLPSYLTTTDAMLAVPKPEAAEAAKRAELMVLANIPAPEPPRASAAPPAATPAVPEASPMPQAAKTAKYTGEPISVNLKDVDLKDFFRLIHEISGLNVVLDPNVKGSVTIVLDDVPWDQALDIVMKNNSLGKELDGNVLRIATLATMKAEEEQRRDLAAARLQAGDQVTVTRSLSYARAEDLITTLKKFLSPRGDLIADKRMNTLIIKDVPQVLPEIDNLIKQLDRKTQQVEIEARVISATRSFARDIGSQFGFSTSANPRTLFGGALQSSPFTQLAPPFPPLISGTAAPEAGTGVSIPLSSNLPAVAPTSGFTFSHFEPNFRLDLILTAAEQKGLGKILSKPRIITQNNAEGEIKQGVRIPIQTTVNNTISTQFIDVVLRLKVTPQITAEGTIFMDVEIENTTIDPGIPRINGIPALDTQKATTKVLVADNGTVVIGGVMITNTQTTIQQVPLFGSIPVLGHLFKRTSVSTNSQELLLFLTPRLVES